MVISSIPIASSDERSDLMEVAYEALKEGYTEGYWNSYREILVTEIFNDDENEKFSGDLFGEVLINAEKGDDFAQLFIASAYMNGDLYVAKDIDKSIQWYDLASRSGNSDAQLHYGALHFKGVGVYQDELKALMWITISAKNGNPDALEGKDLFFEEIPSEARLRIVDLAKKCEKSGYQDC
jgi:TPR repeat protein